MHIILNAIHSFFLFTILLLRLLQCLCLARQQACHRTQHFISLKKWLGFKSDPSRHRIVNCPFVQLPQPMPTNQFANLTLQSLLAIMIFGWGTEVFAERIPYAYGFTANSGSVSQAQILNDFTHAQPVSTLNSRGTLALSR